MGLQNKNVQNSKVHIELTTSTEDWKTIRECYVKSFFHYPLYVYMVPDESKREEFLRAYLDANYEVTVSSGYGILLRIRVTSPRKKDELEQLKQPKLRSDIVGGVVFVPPSSDNCGWEINSDEPYWKAYEKYKLGEISKTGLDRVKRYEAWENENFCEKLKQTRIPLWNGLFCALKPEYTSQGVGSSVYKEAIRIMAKCWLNKNQHTLKSSEVNSKPEKINGVSSKESLLTNLLNLFSSKNLHYFTMLNHRPLPRNNSAQIKCKSHSTVENQKCNLGLLDIMESDTAPLVVAISHSTRAAKFHESNGFQQLSRIPYYDSVEDLTPFYTHVLTLDPFRTGKTNELYCAINSPYIDTSETIERELQTLAQEFVLL